MGLNENNALQWSAVISPRDVLIEFWHEVKRHWGQLNAFNWTDIESERVTVRELYLMVESIHRILQSLRNLIDSACRYSSIAGRERGGSPELDMLVALSSDWMGSIRIAMGFCELLMCEGVDQKDSEKSRHFLKKRLSEMDGWVKSFDEFMFKKVIGSE